MDTKRIKLLAGTVCGGNPVKAGDEVDASKSDAHLLVQLGKAQYIEAKAPKPAPKKVTNKMHDGGETRDAG